VAITVFLAAWNFIWRDSSKTFTQVNGKLLVWTLIEVFDGWKAESFGGGGKASADNDRRGVGLFGFDRDRFSGAQ
jgi:hypothetical protein